MLRAESMHRSACSWSDEAPRSWMRPNSLGFLLGAIVGDGRAPRQPRGHPPSSVIPSYRARSWTLAEMSECLKSRQRTSP